LGVPGVIIQRLERFVSNVMSAASVMSILKMSIVIIVNQKVRSFKMNIEKLYEALESIGHYYKIAVGHENKYLKPEPLILCEIDNKIDELKDLLYDAIEKGLKEKSACNYCK
jgi:hypothetical protein